MRFLKMITLGLFVLGGFAGVANAGQGKEAMSRYAQSIKRIGVASAVGDQLRYHQMGVTRFDTRAARADISSWGFVSYIEGLMAETLNTNARHPYTVEPIFVDRTKKTAKEIALAAMANQPAAPVDAYVIIEPVRREPIVMRIRTGAPADNRTVWGESPEEIAKRTGMGIYRDKVLGTMTQHVYTAADLVLIDGRNLTEINRVPVRALGRGNDGGRQSDGIIMFNDSRQIKSDARWPEAFGAFSANELQTISDNMATLWQMSVQKSLRELGLTY